MFLFWRGLIGISRFLKMKGQILLSLIAVERPCGPQHRLSVAGH